MKKSWRNSKDTTDFFRITPDGRWDAAYTGQDDATVPDDLQEALNDHPLALGFFLTLNSVNRYAILFRVQTAKKAEARAARIQKFYGPEIEEVLVPPWF